LAADPVDLPAAMAAEHGLDPKCAQSLPAPDEKFQMFGAWATPLGAERGCIAGQKQVNMGKEWVCITFGPRQRASFRSP